jgi:hypothetical protein
MSWCTSPLSCTSARTWALQATWGAPVVLAALALDTRLAQGARASGILKGVAVFRETRRDVLVHFPPFRVHQRERGPCRQQGFLGQADRPPPPRLVKSWQKGVFGILICAIASGK